MPGRAQALMRTRCPACATVFRVTSEQLRLKAGKVRCGQCQTVFNAFDQLLPDDPLPGGSEPAARPAEAPPVPLSAPVATDVQRDWPEIIDPLPVVPTAASPADAVPVAEVGQPSAADWLPEPLVAMPSEATESLAQKPPAQPSEELEQPDVPSFSPAEASAETAAPAPEAQAEGGVEPVVEPVAEPVPHSAALPETAVSESAGPATESPETLAESTEAARAAGLVAPRELNDAPTYNRWAAGTLADGGQSAFGPSPARRAVWPFVVVAALLLIVLAGQLLQHFRSEVVRWWPEAAPYYALAGLAIPLSRNPELVAIEASDLQSDNVRGLFVLQATLHNRAPYPQAWPALELTLTDAGDTVVSRRVMSAAEYLPPAISPEIFPANGEVAVRLWIEARNIGAAGYRLYVFYP